MKIRIICALVILLSLHAYSQKHSDNKYPRATASVAKNGSLSAGGIAVASSSKRGCSANKAIDNSRKSFWQSNKPEEWIVVDLEAPYQLTSICQEFQQSSVWKFKIEGSVDNENWLLLVDRTKGIAGGIFAESLSGVYRYVKLTVIGSADGFLPSSRELLIIGTNAGKNIALGKQCTNVVLQKDHHPEDALDGNMSTYWIAENSRFPQALTVDLGDVCTLSGIQQIFKDYDQWKYIVEGSNDELQWQVLVDNSDGISGFDFKSPASGKFRYVRLTVLGSAKGYWAHSCEFRIFAPEVDNGISDNQGMRNLAYDALSTTSSFCDHDHEQKKAFDSDNETFWYANDDTYPQWLCADLGLPCNIRNIEQKFAEKDVWSFIIEGSNDNKNWELLSDCRSGIAGSECSKDLNGVYRYEPL